MILEKKRIGNLEFDKCSYLLPEDMLPEHIGYGIYLYYPNSYYGKESEYIKEKDGEFYYKPDDIYYKIHENCFKYPESCYMLAQWDWDEKYETYTFSFVDDRPVLDINEENLKDFWELVKYGFQLLNTPKDENYYVNKFWEKPFVHDGYGNIFDKNKRNMFFSFNLQTDSDFIDNFVNLLNGEKDAKALSDIYVDECDCLFVSGEEIGKFRGAEMLQDSWRDKKIDFNFSDIWSIFLNKCKNNLAQK